MGLRNSKQKVTLNIIFSVILNQWCGRSVSPSIIKSNVPQPNLGVHYLVSGLKLKECVKDFRATSHTSQEP